MNAVRFYELLEICRQCVTPFVATLFSSPGCALSLAGCNSSSWEYFKKQGNEYIEAVGKRGEGLWEKITDISWVQSSSTIQAHFSDGVTIASTIPDNQIRIIWSTGEDAVVDKPFLCQQKNGDGPVLALYKEPEGDTITGVMSSKTFACKVESDIKRVSFYHCRARK